MKHLLSLLFIIALLQACKDKSVDPSKRVRPVGLKISVKDAAYHLTWEEVRIVCITAPCPDVANVEAETYEIQVANNELGPFTPYQTVSADKKSIDIPVTRQGEQLMARIVSKTKGAPPVNSNVVMATSGFLSQSAYYPGFDLSGIVEGGDVTPDGKKAAYAILTKESAGDYVSSLYVAELENERVVASKLIAREGWITKFSQDGQQLVYPSITANGLVIYNIASGTTQILPVTNVTDIQGLDWSPDGKSLSFSTVTSQESRLWKIAASGGPAIPLIPIIPNGSSGYLRQADLDWSPDGRFIAVPNVRNDPSDNEWRVGISLYPSESGGETKHFPTQPGWIDTNPSFSPDGKQLAFLSTRTDPGAMVYSLWVRDLATSKVRRIELLPGLIPSNDYLPRWQGNERLIFEGTLQGKPGFFSVFL